jgi:hypothetical protein
MTPISKMIPVRDRLLRCLYRHSRAAGLRSGLVVIAGLLLPHVFHIGICWFSAILCSFENLRARSAAVMRMSVK